MGLNRGKKKHRIGRFSWSNRKANRGRKPAHGKRAHFANWKEVRCHILQRKTLVVVPDDDAKQDAE